MIIVLTYIAKCNGRCGCRLYHDALVNENMQHIKSKYACIGVLNCCCPSTAQKENRCETSLS